MRDWRQFFTARDCDVDTERPDHPTAQGAISLDRANAVIRDFIEKERVVLYGHFLDGGPAMSWNRSRIKLDETHQGLLLFPEEIPKAP